MMLLELIIVGLCINDFLMIACLGCFVLQPVYRAAALKVFVNVYRLPAVERIWDIWGS